MVKKDNLIDNTMKIARVTIRNIRGFQDQTIELNMIPNKPSIIVASNGSGKSSFATAFNSLNSRALKVEKKDLFKQDETLHPCLIIEDDAGNRYEANESSNAISKQFGVSVINSRLHPVAVRTRIGNVSLSPTSRLSVEPIVLHKKVPTSVKLNYSFDKENNCSLKKGLMPQINTLINNRRFLCGLEVGSFKNVKRQNNAVSQICNDIINRFSNSSLKVAQIHYIIAQDYEPDLAAIPYVRDFAHYIHEYNDAQGDITVAEYLQALQLYKYAYDNREEIKKAKDRAVYIEYKDRLNLLFSSLKQTWQNIKPREDSGQLILDIPDASLISNGERDNIVFLAMLEKAKMELKKRHNILIIDELFDYLDDANLIAAQYYITKLIDEQKQSGSCIFPIIMSHLNPDFYKNYAFQDLKVYYLVPLPHPQKSSLMMSLLQQREEREKLNNDEDISTYLLHYHNDNQKDLMQSLNPKLVNAQWNDIKKFAKYCENQMQEYLSAQPYCPLAVCVQLRRLIEQYCYKSLATGNEKQEFLNTHKTRKKLEYYQQRGNQYPEIFSLLGVIYNDSLHNTDKKNLRQILYSRLQNNTIIEMIKNVVELCK